MNFASPGCEKSGCETFSGLEWGDSQTTRPIEWFFLESGRGNGPETVNRCVGQQTETEWI